MFDTKRMLGRVIDDPLVQESIDDWPFTVVEGPKRKPMIQVMFKKGRKQFIPEEITSMLLELQKTNAEDFLKKSITDVVIAVPAYFNKRQR